MADTDSSHHLHFPYLLTLVPELGFLRHNPKKEIEPDEKQTNILLLLTERVPLYSCLYHFINSGTKRREAEDYYYFNYLKELKILGYIKFTTILITFSKFQKLIELFFLNQHISL